MVPAFKYRRNRSMPSRWVRLASFLFCLLVFPPLGFSQSEEIPAPLAGKPDAADVDALIKVLEDPSARQRLLDQLKTLSKAQSQADGQATTEEPPAVRTAAAEILQSLSEHINYVGERTFLPLARMTNQLPDVYHWMRQQIAESKSRSQWTEVLINLTMVMGIGYLAFVIAQALLSRSTGRFLARQQPQSRLARLPALTLLLLLDLVAVVLFVVAAYLALSWVKPTTDARVVALAWIGAAAVVRTLMATMRFLFAPDIPTLRLWPFGDETSQYAVIWARRLSITSIYGYVTLEAAVVLGLPQSLFTALLSLLGLLVSTLLLILIWQSRETVASSIRGTPERASEVAHRGLRERLASLWHLLASAYVILLFGFWVLHIPGSLRFILNASALTVLILILTSLALRLLASIYRHGIHLSAELRARFPGLEERINRYFPLLHTGARWIVYVVAAFALFEAWGVNGSSVLASEPARVLGGTLGTLFMIIVFAIAVWELTSSLIDGQLREVDRYGRRRMPSARTKTLLAVGRNAAFAAITVVTVLLVLSELGINIAPLLAGAGVVGLAVGFGAQTLVKDIITGAIILFQDLVAVGEVVKVGDTAGLVEAISIRHLRLRDLSGTVHTIPFSAISTISNLTKDYSFYVFDISVAYREDVDRVIDTITDLGAELQQDPEFGPLILAPLEVFGLDRFADSALIVKARIKTLPIQQWAVGREFNRRLKRRFDELNIEIPFPHRTLYFGIDRQGEAPPLRVSLDPAHSSAGHPL